MLYLGYVGFTVPFAFAIAALATGRVGEGWLVETRRWTLFAWGFLTVGHRPRRLVVLRGARLGRLLGVGPGRERLVPAVAHRHRLPPLGDGPGAAGDAAGLEPVAALRHVRPHHPRHVPHPLRASSTRCTPSPSRASARRSSASSPLIVAVTVGLIGWRGDRLRAPGPHRLAAVPRGRVPRQQPAVRRLRLRRAARHGVPADRRGRQRRPHLGRACPYFDRMTMPIGLALLFLMAVAPVLPWRKASGELLRHRLEWPAWVGTLTRRRGRAPRRPGPGPAARLRPRGLRRRLGRAASWCWPPAARAGGAWSAGPTAAWSSTSASCSSPWPSPPSQSYAHAGRVPPGRGRVGRGRPATRSPTSGSRPSSGPRRP